jgi:NodT family efflux transporter outer membrane factor (OMF) lipoprotein
MKRGVLQVAVGLVAIAGCAVGPDYKTPQVAVSPSWRAQNDPRIAAQTAADAVWWRAFNDPVLDRLVELAYQQNLPLQAAGLRIVEARAQLGIATGLQFPQQQEVFGTAEAIGISQNAANVTNLSRHLGLYRLGVDVAWELDFWGKYRRGVQAEAALLLASVADYYSALVSLTAEVARTYVTVRSYEVLLEQARQNVKIQESSLEVAQSRFSNGATSELDPSQAATLLDSTRASVPKLHTSWQQARNALSTLLGQPPGAIESLLNGPAVIPRVPTKVAVGVPAEMLRRRPDIRNAELLAAAQCARIGVAKADLFPSFSIMGSIGLGTATIHGNTPNFVSTNSLFYQAGPSFNWPFLNYGRLSNAVRVQDARFQQLLVNYRDTVLRAAREVEDALTAFLDAQDASVFETGAVSAARRSVDLSLIAYREGATDFQRVLDAERSLVNQQNNLSGTQTSVATSLIALYKALGGGWELREGQPVIPVETQHEMQDRTRWGDVLSQPRGVESKNNTTQVQH